MTAIMLQTYRFNLSDDVANIIAEFAMIHQYDHRDDFKEAWTDWLEENTELIEAETERLTNLGFQGNVLEKMFKSARFYYRKRTKVSAPSPRKIYESVNPEILEAMDKHIHGQIQKNIQGKIEINQTVLDVSKITPAESFLLYCNENKSILLQLFKDQSPQGSRITPELVEEGIEKIKKTYKNRFYNIRTNYNRNVYPAETVLPPLDQ